MQGQGRQGVTVIDGNRCCKAKGKGSEFGRVGGRRGKCNACDNNCPCKSDKQDSCTRTVHRICYLVPYVRFSCDHSQCPVASGCGPLGLASLRLRCDSGSVCASSGTAPSWPFAAAGVAGVADVASVATLSRVSVAVSIDSLSVPTLVPAEPTRAGPCAARRACGASSSSIVGRRWGRVRPRQLSSPSQHPSRTSATHGSAWTARSRTTGACGEGVGEEPARGMGRCGEIWGEMGRDGEMWGASERSLPRYVGV